MYSFQTVLRTTGLINVIIEGTQRIIRFDSGQTLGQVALCVLIAMNADPRFEIPSGKTADDYFTFVDFQPSPLHRPEMPGTLRLRSKGETRYLIKKGAA
jgi:hypothetical protein